jgi:hypothetical protein
MSGHTIGVDHTARAGHDNWMHEFTVADVLGCLGADLTDAARRVADFPPSVQASKAVVELQTITTATDALSLEVHRVLAVVAEVINSLTAR